MYKVKENNIIKLKKYLEKIDVIDDSTNNFHHRKREKKYFKITKKHKSKPMPTSDIVLAQPENKFLITQLKYNGEYQK